MILQRAGSLKKSNPMSYFKRFEENINTLKEEVDAFNEWENYASAINLGNSKIQSKKLLKRMNEPKYHKTIVGLLTSIEQAQAQSMSKKASILRAKSLLYNSKRKKTQYIMPQKQVSTSFFKPQQTSDLSKTERLRNNDIRFNIRKKQKILQNNWSRLESYRSQHNIYDSQQIPTQNKREKMIITKVLKNRMQSTSTYESQFFSRNKTFESDCSLFR